MKKSPRELAHGAAVRLQQQIAAGVARGKLIGDRNVYFADVEIEDLMTEAAQLVSFFEAAEVGAK